MRRLFPGGSLIDLWSADLKAKKIYTVTAIILLIGLYIVIFSFSAEDGEQSSAVSARVTEALVRGYFGLIGKDKGSIAEMVLLLEGIVRKAAHFLEYMCMGFLSYSVLHLWRGTSKKGILAVLLQVFVSAALDEFHQYFIPGRCASFKDVLIDTAGGIAGILVILLWNRLFGKSPFPSREAGHCK